MTISVRHDPFPVQEPYHGIYAHGVETLEAARLLHISGQVGAAPGGALPTDFDGQCRNALLNVQRVLSSADMEISDLVKVTFFLVRPDDMDDLVAVRKAMLDGVRPAVTTVFVAGLVNPDWLVEIEAVAARPSA